MDLQGLERLVRGDKRAWDAFVERYNRVIYASVRKTLCRYVFCPAEEDVCDVMQDVFVRLCKENYRLLKSYDPSRASLATWLTLVARSESINHLRRRRLRCVPLECAGGEVAAPERAGVPPVEMPTELLSPRQKLVMHLLYDEGLGVREAASVLGVRAQTVRSTKHKALVKLRRFFKAGRHAQ